MKIQIENLRAQMRGVQLNGYQRALALDEYYKLLDYVGELERLTIPAVRVSTYITCSAIWFKDGIKHDHQPFNIETGFVICGHRHHNCFMTAYILNDNEKVKGLEEIQGFMTSENNFVDRKEGGQIAFKAGQTSELKTRLFSEDLY